jgi:hypothetical protein
LFVHGEPAEVSASALDILLGIELKAVAVEEWPGGKTGVGRNSRGVDHTQCRLDALVEVGGNTTTGKSGMSEKKVEVAVVCVRSKTRKNTVRLGDDGVKTRKTLLPAYDIGWNWGPRGNLLGCIVRRCQRANRSGVNLDDAWQVGGLIWSLFHRECTEASNENKILAPIYFAKVAAWSAIAIRGEVFHLSTLNQQLSFQKDHWGASLEQRRQEHQRDSVGFPLRNFD